MKNRFIIIIPDGMGDYPLKELNFKTPLMVAETPNFDLLNREGIVGLANTIPEGMSAGSDVAILSVLGYDPQKYYKGRGPLEAVARGISLKSSDVVFRCNLITTDGERILDYSAGHITTEEARSLLKVVAEKLETDKIKFYPGISYRHLMVWKEGPMEVKCIPPHDIIGEKIKENLPQGEGENTLKSLIWNSVEILDKLDINKRRADEGKPKANMIWLWGQGKRPDLPSFKQKFGITGRVITAVDLVKGIGILCGLPPQEVPGATGYYDTNYQGKADYALKVLEKEDLVLVHIEAVDEAGHNGHLEEKILAIEKVDKIILGTILQGINKRTSHYKILIMPDHYTPLAVRTHTNDAVPFLIYPAGERKTPNLKFNEIESKESEYKFSEGHKLMDFFITGK